MSKSEDPLDDSMTVVKTGTCDTITKKSKLTYQTGTLPDGEVYFRIHKNTGNGFSSTEWGSFADMSICTLMEPPVCGLMEPLLSADFQTRTDILFS